MWRKKILYDIEIKKIWYWGIWIWELDSWKKVLVKWALPWSIVDVFVTKKRKDFVQWNILEVKKIDKKILEDVPFCKHFLNICKKDYNENDFYKIWCWWCKWQILKYENQLKLKENIVLDSFKKILDKQKVQVFPILHSPLEKNYRNKIEFSFWKFLQRWRVSDEWKNIPEIQKHWNLWFHKQWEFSKIIDIDSCWIISDRMNEVFCYMKNILLNSWFPVYDQKIHQWFFRHFVIREWKNTNQILVNLAVNDKYLIDLWLHDKREKLKKNMIEDDFIKKTIDTFFITYNSWLADIVKWPEIKTEVIIWDWYIYEKLKLINSNEKNIEISFRVSAFSFFQTNTKWAEVLFSNAVKHLDFVWLWEKNKWTVLDLYCWTGTIWLSLLKMWIWEKLIWIEIVPEAIKDAKINSKINWLSEKTLFYAWKTEDIVFSLKEKLSDLKLVVVDPPRSWLHKNVVNFLLKLKKEYNFKLLYISCNPITLARDVELFIDWWLEVKTLQVVDMFPHTHHMESIVVMK